MEASKKEKKITVRFYLNKQLEPITGEKRKKYYPLYLYITYDRRNMQLRSKYSMYYDRLGEVDGSLKSFEENTIKKIIRYETGSGQKAYDLRGLKQRYEVYSTSVQQAIEDYVKPSLRLAILKTNDELVTVLDFNQPQATVGRLYKAAKKLFAGFEKSVPTALMGHLEVYDILSNIFGNPILKKYDFPALIDWKNGQYLEELKSQLSGQKVPKEKQQATISLVNKAVEEKLKSLE